MRRTAGGREVGRVWKKIQIKKGLVVIEHYDMEHKDHGVESHGFLDIKSELDGIVRLLGHRVS